MGDRVKNGNSCMSQEKIASGPSLDSLATSDMRRSGRASVAKLMRAEETREKAQFSLGSFAHSLRRPPARLT